MRVSRHNFVRLVGMFKLKKSNPDSLDILICSRCKEIDSRRNFGEKREYRTQNVNKSLVSILILCECTYRCFTEYYNGDASTNEVDWSGNSNNLPDAYSHRLNRFKINENEPNDFTSVKLYYPWVTPN